MEKKSQIVLVAIVVLFILLLTYLIWPSVTPTHSNLSRPVLATYDLPSPEITGTMSVEQAIQTRRSVRRYTSDPLTIKEVSQLLWAAQGITDPQTNYRAAPSGGHTFPLELYLVTGNNTVQGLEAGIYRYDPYKNRLEKLVDGDQRHQLFLAAHEQDWVEKAPISLVITAVYQKMKDKYPDERISTRFVDMEAGHAGENIYLQAVARDLGTVAIGSFYDDQMINLLRLPQNETPLYIYPVGRPAA